MPALRGVVLSIGFFVSGGCNDATAPSADPTPTAVPTPAPTAAPTAAPAFAAACGSPLPRLADLYGFGIKVQLEPSVRKKILNANPYVRNSTYCQQAGLPGIFCETRIETDPGRVACDNYISGMSDEGGPGPIWYQLVGGTRRRCGGRNLPGDAPDCFLKENQYLLDVYAPGKYLACGGAGSNGTCGECILEPETYETPPQFIGQRRPGLCGLGG